MLSDPQERAWYDRHREQILKGSGSEYEDNALCVFQYFTASCYSGFGDDDKGFYTIFRNVFEQLATEEIEHLESENDYEAIPRFGDSTSDYESVVQPFYAYWQSFCTAKSYAWLSEHNITEIRDRRILKVVEKENKKLQQKARKERNEEIRGLVSFVRKRDRRVQAQRKLLEQRAAENRARQAQLDLQQVLKRKQEVAEQAKNQSTYLTDGYEEQLRQLEKAMQSSDDEAEGDLLAGPMQDIHLDDLDEMADGDQPLDCEFFCVACNKTFKTQSSFRNHESSKKHKENVELIKREMLEEEDQLRSDDGEIEEDVPEPLDGEDVKEVPVEEDKPTTSSSKKSKKKQKGKAAVTTAKQSSSGDEDAYEEATVNAFLIHSEDDDDDWGAASTSKSKTSKGKAKSTTVSSKKPKKVKKESAAKPATADPVDSDDQEDSSEVIDVNHKCVTCAEQFSSKNKLFMHLKKTNHGVYLPKGKVVTQADVSELKKGKGARRK